MNIQISKRFAKDTERINDPIILAKIRTVLENAKSVQSVSDIAGIKEMSGHPGFYRIKFDYRYRMGIYCELDTVQFLRVGPRGDFYKKFP